MPALRVRQAYGSLTPAQLMGRTFAPWFAHLSTEMGNATCPSRQNGESPPMRDDLKVIDDLCDALGGLSATARELSTEQRQLTPQHVYNWRKRGRVSPEQRLNFLTLYNRVMPKRKHLDLTWLASPAANNDGSATHGRKSRRKAAARRKARSSRQAQRGGDARTRA